MGYRVGACLVAVLALAPDASAQQAQKGGEDLAVAESLFREGKVAMREKRYDEACAKFAESNRLDPQTGTLLNLAACHETAGKTASAWGEFNEVIAQASRAGQTGRVEFAKQHAAAVEAKLSRVKLVSTEPAGSAAVKVDGKTVGAASLGTPIPMDPGPHRIEASAPGKRPRDAKFDVPQGPSVSNVQVPALDDRAAAPPRSPPGTGTAATGTAGAGTSGTGTSDANPVSDSPPPPGERGDPTPNSSQRTLGFVLGGVGIAGLAVGTVFGVMYLGKQSDYNQCARSCGTNEQDRDQKSSAQTAGWISTAALGVGLAGLAAGTILILTSKPSREKTTATVRVTPALGPKNAGFALFGDF